MHLFSGEHIDSNDSPPGNNQQVTHVHNSEKVYAYAMALDSHRALTEHPPRSLHPVKPFRAELLCARRRRFDGGLPHVQRCLFSFNASRDRQLLECEKVMNDGRGFECGPRNVSDGICLCRAPSQRERLRGHELHWYNAHYEILQ